MNLSRRAWSTHINSDCPSSNLKNRIRTLRPNANVTWSMIFSMKLGFTSTFENKT